MERDTKFAIKAGMATAILASPAFIDSTRPTFVAFFGDWALISVSRPHANFEKCNGAFIFVSSLSSFRLRSVL